MDQKSSAGSQIYTSICVNLLTMSYGTSVGWISPALTILKTDNSPLKSGALSLNEIAIIGGAQCAGGFISACFYGWLADKIGRKKSLISLAVPHIIGWLLVFFAQNSYYLMISRLFHGFGGGGTYIVAPLLITEISEDRIRGRLGSLLVLSCNVGILFAYIIGAWVDYFVGSLSLIVIQIVFLIAVSFIHESPIYLLKKRHFKQAEESLKFYRGMSKQSTQFSSKLKYEYDKMISLVDNANCDTKITTKDFLTKAAIKSIVIGMFLMVFALFTGCYALLSYASLIFNEAGSTLSPNLSAIVVGSIQVVGVYVSTILVDRAGRKFLMITSSIFCAFGCSAFTIYDYLKVSGMDVTQISWIPLVSFSFVIFFANFGIISLPFLVLTELTPMKIKSIVYTFNLSFSWIVALLTVVYLPSSIEILGLYGTMAIFAINSLAAAIFISIIVPETKNRGIEEIQEIMSR